MRLVAATLLACLLITAGAGQSAAPGITQRPVINEILVNPEGTDRGNEWVELYNPTPLVVDLTGWMLVDNRGRTHALDGLTLLPEGLSKVLLDGHPFTGAQLANSGGYLELRDPTGEVEDRVRYGNAPFAGGTPAQPAPPSGWSLARAFVRGEDGWAFGGHADWYLEEEPSPGEPNQMVLPYA
ncbi:MAG: lamin tail domain-containing protein [Thermoplasmatota archaeon]